MITVKRKEIWWVNFDAVIITANNYGEIQKVRPAIIVSNNCSNQFSNRVQVVPLTSKTSKLYPSETYINNKKSKAIADQIMTVSKNRLKSKIGIISDDDMKLIEHIMKIQLGLLS